MTLPRHAARRDAAEPDIVKALHAAGFRTWRHLPVDLLVWRADRGFAVLEVKTPTRTGKRRSRRDQEAQAAFIADTGCPVVLTPLDALQALKVTP